MMMKRAATAADSRARSMFNRPFARLARARARRQPPDEVAARLRSACARREREKTRAARRPNDRGVARFRASL